VNSRRHGLSTVAYFPELRAEAKSGKEFATKGKCFRSFRCHLGYDVPSLRK
jgi:hypothetical protein